MNQKRREVLKLSTVFALAVSAGIMTPRQVFAAQNWNEDAFDAHTLEEAIKALGGGALEESDKIILQAPDIAENGAVVPVSVSSELDGTTEIAILVPDNPSALTAYFEVPEGTLPEVATRIKMGETSDVYGVVKAGDKYYMTHKEVKVTLGGCGG